MAELPERRHADRRAGEGPEQRLAKLPRSILATLLRVGRRIDEDKFEGEITICTARGGVRWVRWTQTETGDVIKEELG